MIGSARNTLRLSNGQTKMNASSDIVQESLDHVATAMTKSKFIASCAKSLTNYWTHAQKKNKPLPHPTTGRNLEELLMTA